MICVSRETPVHVVAFAISFALIVRSCSRTLGTLCGISVDWYGCLWYNSNNWSTCLSCTLYWTWSLQLSIEIQCSSIWCDPCLFYWTNQKGAHCIKLNISPYTFQHRCRSLESSNYCVCGSDNVSTKSCCSSDIFRVQLARVFVTNSCCLHFAQETFSSRDCISKSKTDYVLFKH